jgi:hypothetical protein
MGCFSGYSPECVEGGFSEVRRLVLRRSRLGTLFEGAVHLLKPLLRVGLKLASAFYAGGTASLFA